MQSKNKKGDVSIFRGTKKGDKKGDVSVFSQNEEG